MPSLNDQLNSFKARMRSAPVLGKRVVDQPARPHQNTSTEEPPEVKRRRVVHSQPASTGSGQHRNTQLVHAIEYLRKYEAPVSLDDLESYLSSPVDPLIPLMKANPRIHIDMRNNTATYVSKLGVYSGEDLLRFLAAQKTFQGVPVRELKDGWSGAIPTIKQLEEQNKVLVLRNKKDGQPRLVWPNALEGNVKVDDRFVSLWQSARVPTEADLPRSLERVGLKPSSVDPSQVKHSGSAPEKSGERKQRRAPRSKITNTHLRGILKDFS